MKKDFLIVGKPVIRQDGLEKVTGKAKFADDYRFAGTLASVMVRLPVTHAKIKSVDYSAIKDHPALYAICDADDVPGTNKVGPIRKDQPIFCNEKIVTPGDVIAMLIGESADELLKLRDKINIEYETLPVVDDAREALKPGARLIHPEYESNLIVHYPLRRGNIDKGFAECDTIIEESYSTPLIEHAYIEPEAVTAILKEGKKGIHIIGSIQNPFSTRKVVAQVLGWPLAKVRIEQAELGGSFGGKDDIMNILAARAAVASLKTGRPVKIHYSREDSILESYKRHPYFLNYKIGYNNDGKIKAMKIDLLADGGAYSSMSPFVTWRSVVQATGPYEIENVWTDVKAVYTNNPYTGAMRGFGSPQPIFAQESLMDEIALRLGISPEEIRRINGYKQNSVTASGQTLENHDVNLIKVMDTAIRKTNFTEKWQQYKKKSDAAPIKSRGDSLILTENEFVEPDDVWRHGIGLSISFRGCSLGAEGIDAAAAYLSVQTDGSLYLLSGLAENGQGMRTTYAIIAAEIFGISVDDVYYLELDTGNVPDSGPTVASRATLMGGGAVREAAETVRKRLETCLRNIWELPGSAEIVFESNQVFEQSNPDKKISFAGLCGTAYGEGVNLATVGWYAGPEVHWDEETGQGSAYFTYVYGCQVAEVRVNMITGEVYIDRIVAVHDPGRVINMLGALGQVYGGVTQGAGYGLWEEISTHEGSIRELNYDQYLIPTSKDIGEIVPIFVEGEDQYGAWGAKSLGEPTLELTSAAIANAIRNATGIRFYNLPLNLEELVLKRKLRPEDLKRGSAE
ncbi:MAG: xanthine dehydrogenase family protein molybdopterin-binding subunit [Calditrichaceae bacterium]